MGYFYLQRIENYPFASIAFSVKTNNLFTMVKYQEFFQYQEERKR